MSVLLASYSAAPGGAERILLDCAVRLPGQAILATPDGPLMTGAREAGLPVIALRSRAPELRGGPVAAVDAARELAGHARELRSAAAATRPTVLVAWGMRPMLAAPAALATLRSAPALVAVHVDLLPAGRVGRAVRAAARRADRVVCLSRAIADDLDPDGRLEGRIDVLHPGVDLTSFTPVPLAPGTPARALVLGALTAWKRPDLALEIVALAARSVPDLRVTLAGHRTGDADAGLERALRERAARPDLAGRVTFAGAVGDPRAELAACTCLLHAADREPYGLVIAEALAAGRAVVAAAAGGPAEIADATCARLYPSGNVTAAARALAELAGDPALAAAMGAAGRRRAEAQLDVEDSARRFAAVIATAADRATA